MLQNISFDKLSATYRKYFSLNNLGPDINDKFACISLICYITYELRKKGKKATCYDVLLSIAKDFTQLQKDTFLKSLGVLCEDLMYGCDTFPTFEIKPQEMVKTVRKLLDNYVPF